MTLIELMVALAITMIMMTAVVTLFANLSSTVSSSRALIEVSERLRAARNRLQQDLAGHTASTLPPLRPEDGEGYLEIIEGPNSDSGSALFTVAGTGLSEVAGASVPNPIGSQLIAYPTLSATTNLYSNSIMGDADDILALTVRSQGEPFVGWGYNPTTNSRALIESPTAEVIWYAMPNGRSLPTTGGSPVQLYTLYRRVLLVSPQSVPTGPTTGGTAASAIPFGANVASGNTVATNPATIPLFYNLFDVSVRSSPWTSPASGSAYNIAVGNTLTDLSNRQNRFLHAFQLTPAAASNYQVTSWGGLTNWPTNVTPPATGNFGPVSFPYELLGSTAQKNTGVSPNPTTASTLWALPAALINWSTNMPTPVSLNIGNPIATNNLPYMRLGEDVILTDVLSFDIRVFDPMAPLLTAGNGEVLVPSDPGYSSATGNVAGFGAFVDLGYSNLSPIPTTNLTYNAPSAGAVFPKLQSYFAYFPNAIGLANSSGTPTSTVSLAGDFNSNAQYMPQTYDTFSLGFEQDGIDEDETNSPAPGKYGIVDQGTDGLDDDPPTNTSTGTPTNPDGVVDNVPQISPPTLVSNGTAMSVTQGSVSAGERETLPPYPFPLRGVQVILRVYEPDTRQVRQVTIVQDFLPD